MKLQEKLDAYKAQFVKKAPAEALAVMQRVTANLKSAGIAERAVKVGDVAPDFTLINTDDSPVSLADLLKDGPVVLGFYRGRW
jgi:hypothetical protein